MGLVAVLSPDDSLSLSTTSGDAVKPQSQQLLADTDSDAGSIFVGDDVVDISSVQSVEDPTSVASETPE